ncbi:hypothetical protein ACFFJT_14295 [Dyella flava]|uniref:Uncharacterized protein n=1 Tax=Dyella flava TaxID=1920170 RepID=A0ABS2K1H1_9GAMM|nr:hypothetical protein [Dyella flava]MBM7125073.1 hypothetical protein [Dyella flava]GLQ51946.1 hypothetical protein GCM10010872_33950 [Dyella flava]
MLDTSVDESRQYKLAGAREKAGGGEHVRQEQYVATGKQGGDETHEQA